MVVDLLVRLRLDVVDMEVDIVDLLVGLHGHSGLTTGGYRGGYSSGGYSGGFTVLEVMLGCRTWK